ncbi:hypothetical protein VHUM_02109 [Vanrija humicola]|uniref:D-isomer specific 2-hydroxyacid dehydrogenase NAD-binding domain-containing protein n=1 Tax=Vanrija humicola TaxID=5417 RepID=A0A7D8ZPB7_VANHU|nr:hypothetical protein VHUM_02109 [Vanrija humicola]
MTRLNPISTVAVLIPLPDAALAKLRAVFPTVHYHPDFTLPAAVRPEVEFIFTTWAGLPSDVALADIPKVRHVQLGMAGADKLLSSPAIAEIAKRGGKGPTVSTASGTHVVSIPQWVVGNVINLFHQMQSMISFARTNARWASEAEVDLRGQPYFARSLYGRTAGMLGYGALGRESARLLKAHGMRVIAANTSGRSTSETEYVIPGTGDPDGSVPSAFFSTKDEASFDEFLSQTDVLVCSMPSTPATRGMLTAERLAKLRPGALLINIGRGDLVASADILAALDDGTLFGAALDVTDPEPLPEGHALWTHPRAIVTPHLSGNAEGEYDIATDIALENAKRVERGERPFNVVDLAKGY